MAEGAIIFLLKVVYFSIERWCTFGLTNTIRYVIIIADTNKSLGGTETMTASMRLR